MKITNADLAYLKRPSIYNFLDSQGKIPTNAMKEFYSKLGRKGNIIYKPHSFGGAISKPDMPLGLLRKLDAGVDFTGAPLGVTTTGLSLKPVIPNLQVHDKSVIKFFRNRGIGSEGDTYLASQPLSKYNRGISSREDRFKKIKAISLAVGLPLSLYLGRRWLRRSAVSARRNPVNRRAEQVVQHIRKDVKNQYTQNPRTSFKHRRTRRTGFKQSRKYIDAERQGIRESIKVDPKF